MISTEHGHFVRLLQIILPNGGYVFGTLEAYFDESESRRGAPFLCVAGYVFEAQKAIEFDREWRQMLKDFDLPYFHMTSCEARAKPFESLEREVRTAIQRRAARIVNASMSFGVVVSTDPAAYLELIPAHPLIARQPYSFCVYGCFMAVRQRVNALNYDGKIAYVFEAGQEHQEDTDRLMREYMNVPSSAEMFRYQSHAFIKKTESTMLQAADLLAWHCMKNFQITDHGEYSRDDFVELIDDRYWRWHFDRNGLEEHAKMINRIIATYPDAGKL